MSWLSTNLPSLANLFTTNPTLATNIYQNFFNSKKAAATSLNSQLHSLSVGAMENPTGVGPGSNMVSSAVSAMNNIPNISQLNMGDSINLLQAQKDQASLLQQIDNIERSIAQYL